MKIGIIGENSYISKKFCFYTLQRLDYTIDRINSRTIDSERDLKQYDLIIHAAGIAHVSKKQANENDYYYVNRDLPLKIAMRAKDQGVKRFIFFSSIIVYGDDKPINDEFVITKSTRPNPVSFYGKSKLEAEVGLLALQNDNFKVSIIRLPMVYGEGCKGNFPKLIKLARSTFLFPSFPNRRSMIYIGNLCRYLELIIDEEISGILYPQDSEYIATKDIIREAAIHLGKTVYFTNFFDSFLIFNSKMSNLIRKIWGTKIYEKTLSPRLEDYNVYSFKQSIERYFTLAE